MRSSIAYSFTILFAVLMVPHVLQGQDQKVPDGTEGLYFKAEKDSLTGKQKTDVNEVATPFSTFKLGMGLIYDFTAYDQNATF